MFRDGILWVAAANVVVWTGLFFYLLRLDRRQRDHARGPR